MPSITTHHYFAKEVLKQLNDKEKQHIIGKEQIYYTFAQSHDYLYYYNLNLFNRKKIKQIGKKGHHEKTQDYILNIIKEIKNNNKENNKEYIAYLYGVITHYCLDTTCHPYIFYKTGVYRKKESPKYRGEHNHIEKDLDSYYYTKYTNKNYKYCNISKDIIGKPKFSKDLNNFISNIYYKTYKIENISKYYQKGIRDAKIINTLFMNDYLGIKEKIYQLIDFITKKHFGPLRCYSTHNTNINIDFLNNHHHKWNHPCFIDQRYTYSFDDLFNQSLKKAITIIKAINNVLYDNKDISTLYKIIPNIDYSTGLLIEKNIRMNYFAD